MQEQLNTGRGRLIDDASVAKLRSQLLGPLLLPSDDGYNVARRPWNQVEQHPAIVVSAAGAADIMATVNFARERGLPLGVQATGHGPVRACDNGILINLSLMKGVWVDPSARTARAQAGVTWGELLHETEPFGLVAPSGEVSNVGIAGYTTGGGFGWLLRKYGAACDNLLSVDIVTADGKLLTASKQENEELFWAVRGGGGNFGILTSLEFRLHHVPNVLAGTIMYPASKAKEVFRLYREWVTMVPDELTSHIAMQNVPDDPSFPTDLRGKPVIAIGVCYAGPVEAGEQILRPLREFGSPGLERVAPMSYAAVSKMHPASALPGMKAYRHAEYLRDLSDDTIKTLIALTADAPDSPLGAVQISHLGGALSQISEDTSAFSHRDAPFLLLIASPLSGPEDTEMIVSYTQKVVEAMEPFITGKAFFNYLRNEGEARVRAAYTPQKYARLVSLKQRFDPTNLFHLNQNIPPFVNSIARFEG